MPSERLAFSEKEESSLSIAEVLILFLIFAIVCIIVFSPLKRGCYPPPFNPAGSLRTIATAQSQFQSSNTKDRDGDGQGEYGYFTELSGELPTPTNGGTGELVNPTFLSSAFGATATASAGIATKSGYYFLLFLPSSNKADNAIPESGGVVPSIATDPTEIDNQETRWCCYAWPVSAENSGKKAYFINQFDEVFATDNIPEGKADFYYSGLIQIPNASDIFNPALSPSPNNIDGVVRVGTPDENGLIWRRD